MTRLINPTIYAEPLTITTKALESNTNCLDYDSASSPEIPVTYEFDALTQLEVRHVQ